MWSCTQSNGLGRLLCWGNACPQPRADCLPLSPGCLSALVYQHSIMPLALPCKLVIPDRGKSHGQQHGVPLPLCHLGCAGGFPASQKPRSGLCLPSGASPWGHTPLLSVLRAVPPAGSCAQLVQSQAGFYPLSLVPHQHWHLMLSSWKGDSASAPTAWWVSKQGAAVTSHLF